jgi:DNA (cytosine-5)-methyltransferase 1
MIDSGSLSANDVPETLYEVTEQEREVHAGLVSRNIDFVVDGLAAEDLVANRRTACACPNASPAVQARKRSHGNNEPFPCCYSEIDSTRSSKTANECCDDPLHGSETPLDAFAAVAIADNRVVPAQRYQDHRWRELIAELREERGEWEAIADLRPHELNFTLQQQADGRGIDVERTIRLYDFLEAVCEYPRTSGVSLSDLPNLKYERLAEEFASFPGISHQDAWWLLLTVYEKPVWPTSRYADQVLAALGLLTPDEYQTNSFRREAVEDLFSDRRLPVLHRLLSIHGLIAGTEPCRESCSIKKFLLTYRHECQKKERLGPTAVDLFSGAGGLSAGFKQAGFKIQYAVDKSEAATDTYRLNHPEIPHRRVHTGDINDVVANGVLEDLANETDVVIGGPPCQALSIAGYRSRLADDEDYRLLEDSRTTLYQQYIEAINQLNPNIIVMENVEGMICEIGDTGVKVSDMVLDGLDEAGYEADFRLIDCSEFGLPQTRERVIIFGVNRSARIDVSLRELFTSFYESRSSRTTIRQALAGLPRIERGDGGRMMVGSLRGNRSDYIRNADIDAVHDFTYNHRARNHPKENDRKLFDEVMEPGMDSADVVDGTERGDLIDYDIGTEDNPRFPDKYRMLDWEEPSPTIVAHLQKDANGFILPDYHRYFAHSSKEAKPERNRGITPREAARIQSFPDDYIFLGSFTDWFQQIGNAVPPLVGRLIASTVMEHIQRDSIAVTNVESYQPQVSIDD